MCEEEAGCSRFARSGARTALAGWGWLRRRVLATRSETQRHDRQQAEAVQPPQRFVVSARQYAVQCHQHKGQEAGVVQKTEVLLWPMYRRV